MPRNVVAIGIFGGFGRHQNVVGRREALHPSRIKNPDFINTNAAPKPMMPIATVPISEIFTRKIRALGINEVYATTHYLHDVIQKYYFEGEGKGLIDGLWRERVALGTAPGLVMNAAMRSQLQGKTLLVFAGDILSNINIAEALQSHRESASLCTVALNPVPSWEVGRLGTAKLIPSGGPLGEITEFREKRPLSEALKSKINGENVYLNNASVYFLEPELFLTPFTFYGPDGSAREKTTILEKMFPHIEHGFLEQLRSGRVSAADRTEANEYIIRFGPPNREFNDFGFHLFPQLARNGLMKGYHFNGYWSDIKTNELYWLSNWDALSGRLDINIPFPQCAPGIWRHPTAEVADLRSLEPPVVIGPNVRIDVGTKIGPFAVIDQGWEIGKRARISYSVLWRRFAGEEDYPAERKYQVVLPGATIEKSFVAGILPVGDHLFKIVMSDSRAGMASPLGVRSLTPLRIPPGSEAAVAKQTRSLLIIDNSGRHLNRMRKILGKKGWEWIETAANYEEAEEKLASNRYDLIILDSHLPAPVYKKISGGIDLLKKYKLSSDAVNRQSPLLVWRYKQDLPGLTSEEVESLITLGAVSRLRDSKEVAASKLSDFLLKELLGIDPSV